MEATLQKEEHLRNQLNLYLQHRLEKNTIDGLIFIFSEIARYQYIVTSETIRFALIYCLYLMMYAIMFHDSLKNQYAQMNFK